MWLLIEFGLCVEVVIVCFVEFVEWMMMKKENRSEWEKRAYIGDRA
jgi:hypothetical protein